jgi:dTDP-4-amino-4,6-dideoxygalactose transaminase
MSSTELRQIPFSPPDITNAEIEEVIQVLKSGWITTGPKTKEFERRIAEFVGVEKTVCLSSATAAMELTLRILGVGPGDEVITTPYTYTATAAVIQHVGARIVFVDVAPGSYEMDYSKLPDAITKNTKVILSVDIAGRMCDYDSILQAIESRRDLFHASNEIQGLFGRIIMLADAAHAFGATRKGLACGTVADFTCFSFHAVKNLTTAEGGAVVWRSVMGLDSDWLYNQYMILSLHGQSKDALAKSKRGDWEYDILYPAYKCNMTDVLAAIGLAQLNRYGTLLEKRRKLIQKYDDILTPAGLQSLQHSGEHDSSSMHLYMTRIPGIGEEMRNCVINKMSDAGVSCNVHYKPLPLFTAYKNLGVKHQLYPNAYRQYENEITLPLYTCMGDEDVTYVCNRLIGVLHVLGVANV